MLNGFEESDNVELLKLNCGSVLMEAEADADDPRSLVGVFKLSSLLVSSSNTLLRDSSL
jgi:hypothetical protein